MTTNICTTDRPETLSENLRRADNDHDYTQKTVRRHTRLNESRVQRMFAGKYDFVPAAIAEILSKAPATVADDLACCVVRGTPYRVTRTIAAPQQIHTPLAGAIRVQQTAADLLEAVHDAMVDGRIDAIELTRIVSKANDTKRAADNVAMSSERAVLNGSGRLNGSHK